MRISDWSSDVCSSDLVFMERAQRRILVQYPKRQMGNKMFGGDSSHLPLKLNASGVIPPIFASSLLLLPATFAGFSGGQGPDWLQRSEERRVGKACVSTCRSRWSPDT